METLLHVLGNFIYEWDKLVIGRKVLQEANFEMFQSEILGIEAIPTSAAIFLTIFG